MNIFKWFTGDSLVQLPTKSGKYDWEISERLQCLYEAGVVIASIPPRANGEDGAAWIDSVNGALAEFLPTEQFCFDSEPGGFEPSVACLRQIIMRHEQGRT